MPEVTHPPPGLSPNTMRIKGKLLKIYAEGNKITSIRLKVQQILEVGSSIPLVSPTDTLLVKISALPDTLGTEFVVIIRHRQVMAQQEGKPTPWQLEHIEYEQDHN